MADDPSGGSDDLKTEFVFVKRGDPPPLEWMARHPGWVKFPAVMIPRDSPHHPDNRAYPPVSRVSARDGDARPVGDAAPNSANGPAPAREGRDRLLPPAPCNGNGTDAIAAYRRSNDAVASYLVANAALDARDVGHSSGGKPPVDPATADKRSGDRPVTRSSSVASPPANTAQPNRSVIFIGGAGDERTKIVLDYYNRFQKEHPGIPAKYFSQNDNPGIIAYIKSLRPDVPVTLVGHSWGGDTAMEVVSALPTGRVQTLVTIDPVGSGGHPFFQAVAKHAGRWIDVNAVGGKWYNLSNLVSRDFAALIDGPKYGAGPSKFTKDFLASDHAHGDFEQMMNEIDPATGEKIADIVAGKAKQ